MLSFNIFFDKLFFFRLCKHTAWKSDLHLILQFVLH